VTLERIFKLMDVQMIVKELNKIGHAKEEIHRVLLNALKSSKMLLKLLSPII